eukprot:TRINITY_DN14152_c0_g1_i1.p1 TRINITY_DN14152_c0_g1~~TRINITY_DN14152_c0_g1_i1.p1  ORF type:complete len:259 (+),score=90.95 TRINITY_DN14152_c0_g1_i1:73-849(+)
MAADGGTPPSPSSAAADAAQASVLRAAAEGEAPRRRADAAEQAVEERAEEAVAGKAPAEAALEPKSQENNLLRMRLAAPQSRVSLLAADQLCKKAGALYEDALRQQAAELEGRQAAAADEAGSRELALTTRVAALERELREQGDLVRELRSRLRAAEGATEDAAAEGQSWAELEGADTALRARVAEPRGRLHGAEKAEADQDAERRREQHRLRGAHAEAAQLAPSRAELLAAREGVQAAINGVLRVAGAGRGAPAHGH